MAKGIPRLWPAVLFATLAFFWRIETASSTPSVVIDGEGPTAILLGSREGPDGETVFRKWSKAMDDALKHPGVELPAVWVLCFKDSSTEALARQLPHIMPFVVDPGSSWASVLRDFGLQNAAATSFGLLGEGVLPHPYIFQVSSVGEVVAIPQDQTIVLMRSKLSGTSATSEEWLPDTFIAQLFCNSKALTVGGLEDKTVDEMSLLELVPVFISSNRGAGGDRLVVIDGTSVLQSMFDPGSEAPLSTSGGNTAGENGGTLYLGTLDLALAVDVDEGDGHELISRVHIVEAPWPPVYVLETVAAPTGIVLVNNVNCGYLDLAINLLRSVRNVSNAKIFWITMDDVSFEFMDDLEPGCVAMYPYKGTERHHAIEAGVFRDKTFKSQVLVRPSILLQILNQGFTLLWTDSDMVWLQNPLPLLPDLDDPTAADLMLQYDNSEDNKCTCLLFMKPHERVTKLLELWIQAIVDEEPKDDQAAFGGPWEVQTNEGLRTDVIPENVFPSGKVFFDHPWEEQYVRKYFPDICIVHNNWISGHDSKVERFKEYHLWGVENVLFPACERR